MLWAAHQLESYKIFPITHSVVAVKDTDSVQISCSLLSPFWRATAFMETLNKHLEYLGLCGDDTEAEDQTLESLNGILLAITEDKQRSFHLLRGSGIFPTLAKILKGNPRCAVKAAHVLSEIAKNEEMKIPCIEADLVLALIPLLESTDQEMLLHAGRAIGRICYDNRSLQEELVKVGVIPSLVRILTDYAESEPLVHVALLALYNLADLDSAKEALSMTKVAEQLVKQLRRAESHERLEIVFEVLQALAENDALKVQLVDAGVPEALSDILLRLQGSSQAEDTCIVKAASDLIVSLLLGDGNCLRLFQLGVIHQLLDLLEKHVRSGDASVQQAALSALQSLAVPVVSKVQMLEEGVAERIEALLRSESPPVQFKLLGTLRTLADGQADAAELLGQDPLLLDRLVQWCSGSDHSGICGEANRLLASILHHNRSQEVVKAIQAAQGVKHLVSMTTSEQAAMQNEALKALAIASAIDLDTLEESFKESQLVQSLHKLLRDDNTSPEVKYNSMGLLCRLLNSGDLRQEIEEDKIKDTLEQLCSHSNADVVKGAITTLQVLRGDTPH
ncbi:LOW QUALITY PROTEIN: rap1 GTPase-GDP dissociation stimulator 1-like [Melospiza georgiana]|uniref:LOW QUALITY PROTEIN: rap1 GTPase-GDP dissociation stimulator 1-like n=1 Tax=Melospiza georgiana TaxID=44398 RepID=UPI0025AB725E|nr:LOW QUALITY PROTEIN: rap1 GTPase-GDP dissociation stimulator 1-like [Melospiza georgiana]